MVGICSVLQILSPRLSSYLSTYNAMYYCIHNAEPRVALGTIAIDVLGLSRQSKTLHKALIPLENYIL